MIFVLVDSVSFAVLIGFYNNGFLSNFLDNTKALADPARWDINSRSWRYQTCSQVLKEPCVLS